MYKSQEEPLPASDALKAFPIYYEMVGAIISFKKGDKMSCIKHLENIGRRLRHLLLIFFEGLTDSRVSRSVWLSYIQGFQGWGVGRVSNGEFIKYDGLSGNHVLFFQALDAFLGMERYLTDENMIRYIPVKQREFCLALKKHSFRLKVKEQGDFELEEKVGSIVKQLKVGFSAAASWPLALTSSSCSAQPTEPESCRIYSSQPQSD